MTTTNNTKKSSKSTRKTSTRVRPSSTLSTIPASEAIDMLRTLDAAAEVIPAHAADRINAQLDDIRQHLDQHNVSVLQTITEQAKTISLITGVPASEITRFMPTAQAEHVHMTRNLLVATAAVAAHTITVDSEATSPACVYANSIALARRSPHTRRPFADDEIVLCRVAATLAMRRNPKDHTAILYALTDAGLTPGETTNFVAGDVDDVDAQTTLVAAGNGHIDSRTLEITTFTSKSLATYLKRARHLKCGPNQSLTYRPRLDKHAPGSPSAVASAQRTLDRFLKELKLPTGDITASSITQWRIASALHNDGFTAARLISGRASMDQTLRALGRYTNREEPADQPAARVSRQAGGRIFSVGKVGATGSAVPVWTS